MKLLYLYIIDSVDGHEVIKLNITDYTEEEKQNTIKHYQEYGGYAYTIKEE